MNFARVEDFVGERLFLRPKHDFFQKEHFLFVEGKELPLMRLARQRGFTDNLSLRWNKFAGELIVEGMLPFTGPYRLRIVDHLKRELAKRICDEDEGMCVRIPNSNQYYRLRYSVVDPKHPPKTIWRVLKHYHRIPITVESDGSILVECYEDDKVIIVRRINDHTEFLLAFLAYTMIREPSD